jgi:hypothetical protein
VIDQHTTDGTGWARFSDDDKLRFRLARSLDGTRLVVNGPGIVESDGSAVFVMLNPSTATAFANDPTITRGFGFARSWGCDVYEAVNIWPPRSTDPAGLHTWTRELSSGDLAEIHRLNLEQIRLACIGAKYVIAAWGVHGAHLFQGRKIREFMQRESIILSHLGLTKDGYPKHPLYLRADTQPQEWI